MPLERLHLRNFQKHRTLTVEFDQHITTIVGRSDVGKSAVLRALRWVCRNNPGGSAFIRHGAKSVKVCLRADGKTVIRKKGGENAYLFSDGKYTAFGSGIPPSIARHLNISDENFQGQFDPVYWLSQSPGQVSRSLNRIVNLGAIDRALAHIAAEVRKSVSAVDFASDRLKQARRRLQDLKWVPECLDKLDNLEKLYSGISPLRIRIAHLTSLIECAEKAEQCSRHSSAAVYDGLAVVRVGQKARKLSERFTGLQRLILECRETERRLCETKHRLHAARQTLNQRTGGVCPLCGSPWSASVVPMST